MFKRKSAQGPSIAGGTFVSAVSTPPSSSSTPKTKGSVPEDMVAFQKKFGLAASDILKQVYSCTMNSKSASNGKQYKFSGDLFLSSQHLSFESDAKSPAKKTGETIKLCIPLIEIVKISKISSSSPLGDIPAIGVATKKNFQVLLVWFPCDSCFSLFWMDLMTVTLLWLKSEAYGAQY